MIQLPCPWCGPRDVAEFRHAGEATTRPDPATASPQEWRAYLHLWHNAMGRVQETWYHGGGCRRYVRIERDTVTNESTPPP